MGRILKTICFLFLVIDTSFAQLATTSPYSRFGLGDLQGTVFAEYTALGGGVSSLSDEYSINPYNPATYSNIGKNTFLLSLGALHNTVNTQNNSDNYISNNTSFSHLTLAFPFNDKIGMSIGLLPYSNIGYELSSRDEEYNADLLYFGDGGLSTAYLGGAYQLSNNLAFGVNANYLFGGLNRRKKLIYDDNTFLHSRSNSKLNINGLYYQFGLIYDKKFQDEKLFSLALTLTNNSDISVTRAEILETFSYSGTLELIKDTVFDNTENGSITLPQFISAGLTYRDGKRILVIADYRIQDWSEYKMFNESDDLSNSMRSSIGLQYIPEYNSTTQYYKRMAYRLGFSYHNTPLQFYNTQLNEKSISLGFGFPIKRSRTSYDFSLVIGERGTLENNLLKEQFIKFGLSISYDSIWFLKRQYD